MSTITDFLAARLDEDEAAAKAWLPFGNPDAAAREHIARHDPARVLREVEAKRKILARYGEMPAGLGLGDQLQWSQEQQGLLFALEHLAAVWCDHPDYDEAWRP